jgi:hypothetical protein
VVTPLWAKETGDTGERLTAMQEEVAARVTFGRVGQPEDIAQLPLCSCPRTSPRSSLPVDGGMTGFGRLAPSAELPKGVVS